MSQKQTGLNLINSFLQRLPLPEINIDPGSIKTLPCCSHCPSVPSRRILARRSHRSPLDFWRPTKCVSQGEVYATNKQPTPFNLSGGGSQQHSFGLRIEIRDRAPPASR